MKHLGSWNTLGQKLVINKEKYEKSSHGFLLAEIIENYQNWEVVFKHKNGLIATFLGIKDDNSEDEAIYHNLELLMDDGSIRMLTSLDVLFEWEIISMNKKENL